MRYMAMTAAIPKTGMQDRHDYMQLQVTEESTRARKEGHRVDVWRINYLKHGCCGVWVDDGHGAGSGRC